jgi:CheY-like chemotaxis protein
MAFLSGSVSAIRILLVEDNLINQKVALRMLSKLGYQAELAVNGQEAVKKVIENDYDLILMDLQMPVMDGITATKNILQHCEESARISPSVVALTANVEQENRDACFESGMVDFLAKPVRMQILENVIAKVQKCEKESGV